MNSSNSEKRRTQSKSFTAATWPIAAAATHWPRDQSRNRWNLGGDDGGVVAL